MRGKTTYSVKGWALWTLTLFISSCLVLDIVLTVWASRAIISVPPNTVESEAAFLASIGRPDSPAGWGLPDPESFTLDRGVVQLAGWYFDNPADGGCGVVLLHGRGGTRLGILDYARLFWPRGCDIVSYDARQHGDSRGAYGTFGFYEGGDALAMVDWLVARAGLARGDIGLFGVSYGATSSLMAAGEAPDLAFAAVDSAFSDLPTIAHDRGEQAFGEPLASVLWMPSLWLAGRVAGFDPWAVSAVEAVQRARSPILLIHSLTDDTIYYQHSERIYAACDPARCVLHLTDWGAPHGDSWGTRPEAYQALVDAFLDEYVPGFAER
ncbi:MAG: alpha/beta hydrolase [Anaerolineae bacterium]|nr:MAG: alpha/beta hydrolase [Anaerolineae bacterium]